MAGNRLLVSNILLNAQKWQTNSFLWIRLATIVNTGPLLVPRIVGRITISPRFTAHQTHQTHKTFPLSLAIAATLLLPKRANVTSTPLKRQQPWHFVSECLHSPGKVICAYQPMRPEIELNSASPRFRRIPATSIHPRKAYRCSLEATSCTWQHK